MSVSKFESEVKYLSLPQAEAYNRFSDLSSLNVIKDRLNDPAVLEKVGEQVPADKLAMLQQYAQGVECEADALHINSPMGKISLRIVERDEPKCLKLASDNSPVPIYVWIQLLPSGETGCKMRVTVGAEVNFFMKGMVAKPLQQAADGLANILSAIH